MVKLGPKARRAEIDRKNREALEEHLKNKALCTFYWPDGSLVTKLLTVFAGEKRKSEGLWKYVRYTGRNYYLDTRQPQKPMFYMRYPPGQHIQVPVLCLSFFVGQPEALDIGSLVKGGGSSN